jgi:hypothetical protein
MPRRDDAIEGVDYIFTDHPDIPGLQCKAWLDENGEIKSYRSLGDDGRRPGRLIKPPKALLDNRKEPGDDSLVRARWQKNEDAINTAVNEFAADLLYRHYFQDDIITEAEDIVDGIIEGEKNFSLGNGRLRQLDEATSTKLLVRIMLERMVDREDKPPLRDIVQTVKEVLSMSNRTGQDQKKMPAVAVQVNITPGLFSKGFANDG